MPASRDDLDRACFWTKVFVGLALGLLFGSLPIIGAGAILSFFTSSLSLTWIVYARVLRADCELLGMEGQIQLLREGLAPGLATFLLVWTVAYNTLHA